jgi:Ca-activated chloride channel family protein
MFAYPVRTVRASFFSPDRNLLRVGSLVCQLALVWPIPLACAQSSIQPAATQRSATAQTEGRSAHGTYTLRQDVNEVVLNCNVLDDKGHLVNGLDKNDFKVTEGKVAQTLIALKHQDVPVSMGVLIDSSGSMRDKRQAVNEAALDLVRASNPDDEAFIVNFSDRAQVAQDFTADIPKLSDGLKRSSGSSGGTALYDTVASSADRMANTATRPKQVLILVTDGEDNASSLSLEQAVQHIQNLNGPIVYSIGLLYDTKGGGARNAKHALEALSDETGGVAYFPHSIADVDAIAAEVARDIRSQYTLAYRPSNVPAVSEYRAVHVEAHAHGVGKLTVRTRRGYRAGPLPPTPPGARSKQ